MTTTHRPDESGGLSLETEKRALLDHLAAVLDGMTGEEARAAVDRFAGAGTAHAVVAERRRQADEARRMLQRIIDERYRDDPEAAAAAAALVGRLIARVKAEDAAAAPVQAAEASPSAHDQRPRP